VSFCGMINFVSKNVSEFPTPPSGGLIPPTFAQHPLPLPPASWGKEGERGRGEEKGKDPQGLVDTPCSTS